MILYRIYQICIMAPILIVWTIITATFTMIVSIAGFGRWAGYWPQILWARLYCWLAFVKVEVCGRDNVDRSTSYVFAANHQGAYDIFAIYGYLGHNFRWMMKQSLRKIPFVGYACEASKQIFVDNSRRSGVQKTLERAREQLSHGMSLVVFPEGSRTPDGQLQPFKRGAFKLAMEFDMPVVPVTIDGSYAVMTRFDKLPRPGRIRLTLHKPIHPNPEGHNLDALMEATRAAIDSAF